MSVQEDLLQEVVVTELPQVVPVVISLHQIILVRNPFLVHDFPVVLGGFDAPGIFSSNSEIDIAPWDTPVTAVFMRPVLTE